jgi:cell fate regulator YaaT (PSP1 superfamily)
MRMAKRQNISLNPSKISGQCGKLLCCLSYENEMYPPLKLHKGEIVAEEELAQEDIELLKKMEEDTSFGQNNDL